MCHPPACVIPQRQGAQSKRHSPSAVALQIIGPLGVIIQICWDIYLKHMWNINMWKRDKTCSVGNWKISETIKFWLIYFWQKKWRGQEDSRCFAIHHVVHPLQRTPLKTRHLVVVTSFKNSVRTEGGNKTKNQILCWAKLILSINSSSSAPRIATEAASWSAWHSRAASVPIQFTDFLRVVFFCFFLVGLLWKLMESVFMMIHVLVHFLGF